MKKLFMATALATSTIIAGLSPIFTPEASAQGYRRFQGPRINPGPYGVPVDPKGTGRSEDELRDLGRDYAFDYYKELENRYPNLGSYGVDSVENRVIREIHPQNLIGGSLGRLMGRMGLGVGTTIANNQNYGYNAQIMASKVITAVNLEAAGEDAMEQGDTVAAERYQSRADAGYLEIGRRIDRNEARNEAQADRLHRREGRRAIPKILGNSPFRLRF